MILRAHLRQLKHQQIIHFSIHPHQKERAKKLFEEHLGWAVEAATEQLQLEFDGRLREARLKMEQQFVDYKYKLEEEVENIYRNRRKS
jgi:hypothetical protein